MMPTTARSTCLDGGIIRRLHTPFLTLPTIRDHEYVLLLHNNHYDPVPQPSRRLPIKRITGMMERTCYRRMQTYKTPWETPSRDKLHQYGSKQRSCVPASKDKDRLRCTLRSSSASMMCPRLCMPTLKRSSTKQTRHGAKTESVRSLEPSSSSRLLCERSTHAS